MHARPRILLVADVPSWIFARHCRTLARLLSDEFEFYLAYLNESYRESFYDLVYPLEFNLVKPEQIRAPAKYVTGIRSHALWQDQGVRQFAAFLNRHFPTVHVVSARLHRELAPFIPNLLQVSHGVDTGFFQPNTRMNPASGSLRIGWAGSLYHKGKGFEEFISPLAGIPGVELKTCGGKGQKLGLEEMRAFYETLDAYVCASDYEGNNNSLLEAAAMERAIITTDNGTVPEYLRHGESALIVERKAPQFVEAAVALRDNPQLRRRLGSAARKSVVANFDWSQKAEQHRQMFRTALQRAQADSFSSATIRSRFFDWVQVFTTREQRRRLQITTWPDNVPA